MIQPPRDRTGQKGLIAVIMCGLLPLLILSFASQASPLITMATGILYTILIGLLWQLGFQSSKTPTPHDLEKTIQQSEYKGESRLANSLQETIVVLNQNEEVLFVNRAAQTLYPQAKTGVPFASLIRDIKIREQIRATFANKPTEPVIFQIHNPVERHFSVTVSRLNHHSPTNLPEVDIPDRVIVVLYDVTDLERVNTMRADFLANASHELKTPIASLLGYIETLNGHAKDDEEARTKFLHIMQQQAERMQRLINDLLSLRRIEQIEHIAPIETGDLYLATRAAMEAVAPIAENRNVKVKYIGPKSLPVIGQQDELVQVILNIVDNAVQISPHGGKVTIHAEQVTAWEASDAFAQEVIAPNSHRRRIINPPRIGTPYTVIRIRDHGPGFKREHLPRICERFYRITADNTPRTHGTGLGLAIVKHITLRHRGGLMVESAEKQGTEFSIALPMPEPKEQ